MTQIRRTDPNGSPDPESGQSLPGLRGPGSDLRQTYPGRAVGGSLAVANRRHLQLVLAQLLLQFLHAVDQRLQHLAGHRSGNDQSTGRVRLAVWTGRLALDADNAIVQRDVRNAVDENLRRGCYFLSAQKETAETEAPAVKNGCSPVGPRWDPAPVTD